MTKTYAIYKGYQLNARTNLHSIPSVYRDRTFEKWGDLR